MVALKQSVIGVPSQADTLSMCQNIDTNAAKIGQELCERETFQTAHKMQDVSNQTMSNSAPSIPSRIADQDQHITNNEAVATTADNYTGPVLRPRKQSTTKTNITRPGPLSDLTPPSGPA